MRTLLSFLLMICFGCSTHMGTEEATRVQMSRLQKGMSDQKVLQVLGQPAQVQKHETFVVWFYVTQPMPPKEKLCEKYLTPVIFKEGYLMDWGYYYYNYLLGEEAQRGSVFQKTNAPMPPPPPQPQQAPRDEIPPEVLKELVPQQKMQESEEKSEKKESESNHKSLWE